MGSDTTFVIVGAGHAGAWTAKTLLSEGFAGRVVMIGQEPYRPYERPPLSKSFLLSGSTDAGDAIIDPQSPEAGRIEFRLAESVERIDRAAKVVHCRSGASVRYDKLFLTPGGEPRAPAWMPAEPSARLHRLRTRDDALALRGALREGATLGIVGGGWIGLEVAATARELGASVEVIEAGSRLCARSMPTIGSEWLHALHVGNHVRFRLSTKVTACALDESGVTLSFDDGAATTYDHVLVSVGIIPRTELAEAAGLETDDGILVSVRGETSDASIYASGDVARHPSAFAGGLLRLESWLNAQNQSVAAARAALDLAAVYDEVPWLWSDQYDRNIQILGLPHRATTAIARGTPMEGKGSWILLDDDGAIAGLIAINAARDVRDVRRMIEKGVAPDRSEWGDPLKPLAKIATVPIPRRVDGMRA